MQQTNRIIDKIVWMANLKYPDSEIYLYGSQARGDSTNFSDWDLLILLKEQKVSFNFETQMMDDFYDIELETGAVISPLIYSKTDWNDRHFATPLYENIQKEGIRIK